MSPCQLCHPGDKCLCSVPPFSAWGQNSDSPQVKPRAGSLCPAAPGLGDSPRLSLQSEIVVLGGWLPVQPLSCSPCQLLCCKRRRGGFDF